MLLYKIVESVENKFIIELQKIYLNSRFTITPISLKSLNRIFRDTCLVTSLAGKFFNIVYYSQNVRT